MKKRKQESGNKLSLAGIYFLWVLVAAGLGVVLVGIYNVYTDTHTYIVSLTDIITEKTVVPVIQVLNNASEKDTVRIMVDSPGGNVKAGAKLIKAMQNTKAAVVIIEVEFEADSMAAMILGYADRVEIPDYGMVMFHTMSYDNIPLIDSSPVPWVSETFRIVEAMLIDSSGNVLTRAEIDAIGQHGFEVYLTGKEYKERRYKNKFPTKQEIQQRIQKTIDWNRSVVEPQH
jgi:hypothetical protein